MTRASSVPNEVAAAAAQSKVIGQMVDLIKWVGDGRRLTQTGAITLTDARVLVERLGTKDEIDPVIGNRVFKTRSSLELRELTMLVGWAKAARLVRSVRDRLVPVKKAAALVDRPADLWVALLDAFERLGPVFLLDGWTESLMRPQFAAGFDVLRSELARDGSVGLDDLDALVWSTVSAPYVLDHATAQQLATARRSADRDVWTTLAVLAMLGAVTLTDETAELTPAGRWGFRRQRGEPEDGDPVYQVRITLADVTDPPVWRRLVIPAAMPLSRLHEVIQLAMGWQDYHLHCFTDGRQTYGVKEPELNFIDERSVRFGDVAREGALSYTYDFGDDWEHEIVVESLGVAEPGLRYPLCIGGGGACPPEDCGGAPGYASLRDVLADADDDDHHAMVTWLGLNDASEFEPAGFDIDQVNRKLLASGARR